MAAIDKNKLRIAQESQNNTNQTRESLKNIGIADFKKELANLKKEIQAGHNIEKKFGVASIPYQLVIAKEYVEQIPKNQRGNILHIMAYAITGSDSLNITNLEDKEIFKLFAEFLEVDIQENNGEFTLVDSEETPVAQDNTNITGTINAGIRDILDNIQDIGTVVAGVQTSEQMRTRVTESIMEQFGKWLIENEDAAREHIRETQSSALNQRNGGYMTIGSGTFIEDIMGKNEIIGRFDGYPLLIKIFGGTVEGEVQGAFLKEMEKGVNADFTALTTQMKISVTDKIQNLITGDNFGLIGHKYRKLSYSSLEDQELLQRLHNSVTESYRGDEEEQEYINYANEGGRNKFPVWLQRKQEKEISDMEIAGHGIMGTVMGLWNSIRGSFLGKMVAKWFDLDWFSDKDKTKSDEIKENILRIKSNGELWKKIKKIPGFDVNGIDTTSESGLLNTTEVESTNTNLKKVLNFYTGDKTALLRGGYTLDELMDLSDTTNNNIKWIPGPRLEMKYPENGVTKTKTYYNVSNPKLSALPKNSTAYRKFQEELNATKQESLAQQSLQNEVQTINTLTQLYDNVANNIIMSGAQNDIDWTNTSTFQKNEPMMFGNDGIDVIGTDGALYDLLANVDDLPELSVNLLGTGKTLDDLIQHLNDKKGKIKAKITATSSNNPTIPSAPTSTRNIDDNMFQNIVNGTVIAAGQWLQKGTGPNSDPDFIDGLMRGAGKLVEGVGSLFANPKKAAKGLARLGGVSFDDNGTNWNLSTATDAWSNLAKEAVAYDQFEKGNIAAGLGETIINVASMWFTGGSTAAVRGASTTGRLARGATKVIDTAINPVSAVARTSNIALTVTKKALGSRGETIANVFNKLRIIDNTPVRAFRGRDWKKSTDQSQPGHQVTRKNIGFWRGNNLSKINKKSQTFYAKWSKNLDKKIKDLKALQNNMPNWYEIDRVRTWRKKRKIESIRNDLTKGQTTAANLPKGENYKTSTYKSVNKTLKEIKTTQTQINDKLKKVKKELKKELNPTQTAKKNATPPKKNATPPKKNITPREYRSLSKKSKTAQDFLDRWSENLDIKLQKLDDLKINKPKSYESQVWYNWRVNSLRKSINSEIEKGQAKAHGLPDAKKYNIKNDTEHLWKGTEGIDRLRKEIQKKIDKTSQELNPTQKTTARPTPKKQAKTAPQKTTAKPKFATTKAEITKQISEIHNPKLKRKTLRFEIKGESIEIIIEMKNSKYLVDQTNIKPNAKKYINPNGTINISLIEKEITP